MPQAQDNPTWPAQAVPDSTDFAVITAGEAGHGIINGLATTVASASAYTYKATVATGTFTVSGVAYSLGSATTVTGVIAGAGDRKDLVSINSAGTVTLTTGTTSIVTNWQTTSVINPPIKPSIPSNNVALAEIYVPGSGSYTTPAATWVTDKSLVLLTSNAVTSGSAAGGDLTGTYPNPAFAAVGTSGTYGSASVVPVITTDSKGRVTGVTNTAIAIAAIAAGAQQDLYIKSAARTSSATITNNEVALFDTTAGALTCTLPGVPSRGQIVVTLTAGSNPLTISAGSGQTFNGSLSSITLTGSGQSVRLVGYQAGATYIIVANSSVGAGASGFAVGGDLTGYLPNPTVVSGSTSLAGKVQLTDSTSSTSTTTAATPNSVKTAYDLANSAHALLNPISGLYYKTPTTTLTTTATTTVNTTHYTPIEFSQSVTLDRIAISTGSSFSGTASVRLGIFANSSGKPGNLILDAGTVAPTAASTSYAITISQALSAGIYWVAMNTITAATTNAYYGTALGTTTFNPLIGGAVASIPGSAGIAGFTQTYTATSSFANAGSVTAAGVVMLAYVRVV